MDRTQRSVVVIGLLGTTLDMGKHPDRWQNWRPSVSLCRQPDLIVRRFELLHGKRDSSLAKTVRADMRTVSPETEVRQHEMEFSDPWDFEEVYETLFKFSRQYPFDTESEDYLIHITTGTHVAQICLFLLTESRYMPGRWGRGRQEQREAVFYLKGGIDTRNSAFNHLIDRIEQVAIATRDPLLLMGPTGAGKSLLAKRIYELKKNRRGVEGSFVEVNCATVRGDAAMSALFGHVKGAFTGAQKDRPGLLRAADKGVLFLDEVGELGLDEQALLLRALEEKTFLPLGSDDEAHSDFQLIAGTNRDLFAAVREGKFRDDLLARINLWTFSLPGLKNRSEDIEPNLDFELDRFAEKAGRRVTFSRESRERFLSFALSPAALWAGNFRDLNAAVARMATLAPGGRISNQVVDEETSRLSMTWHKPETTGHDDEFGKFLTPKRVTTIDLFDRAQLAFVIDFCTRSCSLSEAGRSLFGASRARKSISNDADR